MKYIKTFENLSTNNDIEFDLYKYNINNFIINSDGTIDVEGNVSLSARSLTRIPFKFGKVTGNFYCQFNRLTSLEGSPYEVGGNFNCYSNQLQSLKGSPIEVNGTFDCSINKLVSLEGMPIEIGGDFNCINNPDLKELDSISNIEGDIIFDDNINISKFRGFCRKIIKS